MISLLLKKFAKPTLWKCAQYVVYTLRFSSATKLRISTSRSRHSIELLNIATAFSTFHSRATNHLR